MGIDTSIPLKKKRFVVKGVIPGISKEDKVLLWTGGIWNHFDGKVLMHAMKGIHDKRPDIKLVFMGTQHPNPGIPEMKESLDTRKLADELGLTNKNVFFKDGWVKYPDRIDYLLEADIAINTHKASVETEFSHRTRVLDHLLAGLPTISTEGDYLSDDVIKPNSLGIVVPPNNVEALQSAILHILEPKELSKLKKNIQAYRETFDWHQTMRELKEVLNSSPSKLQIADSANVPSTSKSVQIAKRVLPLPVKKAIIKTLRIKK
jgi:glycosyltransferase involved in cell wall biosynthesis